MNGSRQADRAFKNQRRAANKKMSKLENDVKNYEGCCLFVVDDTGRYCGELVRNNCHIVSESAVLDGLKDDKTKKVLELQWGVSKWRELFFSRDVEQRIQNTTAFDPSERTTGAACVSWFACKQYAHDDEFQPVDVAEPDFHDPEIRFLAGYRMALFAADQLRFAMGLHQKWDKSVTRSVANKPRDRVLWIGEKEKLKKVSQETEKTVKMLGKCWYAHKTGEKSDLDVVSAQVLTFRSKLRFAGGVSYGRSATAVTVFPVHGDWYKMGVLYLRDNSDLAGEDIRRLVEVSRSSEESDSYGVTVLNELLMKGWGSLAVSSKSYEELNDEGRKTIHELTFRHSADMELVRSTVRQASRGKRRRR